MDGAECLDLLQEQTSASVPLMSLTDPKPTSSAARELGSMIQIDLQAVELMLGTDAQCLACIVFLALLSYGCVASARRLV